MPTSWKHLGLRMCILRGLLMVLAICGLTNMATADTVTFGGTIIQSTQDGTGPAVNNPDLNNVLNGDAFLVTLSFVGPIGAGTYSLTSLSFLDSTAAVTESFASGVLTVTANGGFYDFSLLGCLASGSGCLFGNQLDANFRIAAASLNLADVVATGLDQPHPLDLLEDDGVTDIHGNITTYSRVPEPSTTALLGCALAGLLAMSGVKRGRNDVVTKEVKAQ